MNLQKPRNNGVQIIFDFLRIILLLKLFNAKSSFMIFAEKGLYLHVTLCLLFVPAALLLHLGLRRVIMTNYTNKHLFKSKL
jgi:hypothetical protein